MLKIIGVAGQLQNGKDTLADYLALQLNGGYKPLKGSIPLEDSWVRAAFASNVKRIFMETFNKDAAYVEKWKVRPECPPDLDMPVRKALQFIGDGFRTILGTIWLDLVFRDTRQKIISDVRYINELAAVYANKGFNILIIHPDRVNDDPNGSEAQLRPLVDWALKNREIAVSNLEQVKKNYQEYSAPEEIKYLNLIIFNDSNVYALCNKITDIVIPAIHNFGKSI